VAAGAGHGFGWPVLEMSSAFAVPDIAVPDIADIAPPGRKRLPGHCFSRYGPLC